MRSRSVLLALLTPIVLAGIVYSNALDNPFVYDDQRLIVENRLLIETPERMREVLVRDSTRPLVTASYVLDRRLWGVEPFGFHLTNVLLHMVNVGLLFSLAWLVLGDRSRAGGPDVRGPDRLLTSSAAAVLLAVHPMMTQAVGYVSGRAEVLCATWLLLAVLAVRAWFVTNSPHWLLVTLGAWVAGLASKETAIMLPVALVVFDRLVYPAAEADRRWRLLWLHLPLLTFATVGAMIRLFVFVLVEHPGALAPQWPFALVEVDVVRRYLGLLIMPNGQTIFHQVAPISSAYDPRAVAGFALLAGLAWLAYLLRCREPLVTFGLSWFVLALVPSAALVVLDQGEPMAEHRVYTASIGFFLAAGAGCGWLGVRLRRARLVTRVTVGACAVVFVAGLGARTILRNAIWADPVALWTEAVSLAPDHWLPNLALGEALQQAGRYPEAIGRYVMALAANPDELTVYTKLGVAFLQVGSHDEARGTFEELRRRSPDSNEASNGLGAVALLAGQPGVAREYYLQTLGRDRRNLPALRALAALDELTDPASALRYCEAIAEVAPRTPGNDECISRSRARLAAAGGSGG